MAAANPQPLQARPLEDHMRGPIRIEDEEGDYEDGGDDAMDDVEDAHMNSVSVAEHGEVRVGGGAVVMASRTSELTLSFEGEVYVFPAVTPEKVTFFFFRSSNSMACFNLVFIFVGIDE